jgi:hypothetical protein
MHNILNTTNSRSAISYLLLIQEIILLNLFLTNEASCSQGSVLVTAANGSFGHHKYSPARNCVLKRPQQLLTQRRYPSSARSFFSCVEGCNAISGF